MRIAIASVVVVGGIVTIGAQQTTEFQRGEMVRVAAPTNPSDPPASSVVLTIVGMPGDRLRAGQQTSTMFVNGEPVTRFTPSVFVNDSPVSGFSPDFVARVAFQPNRIPAIVPQDHYFVMGKQRSGQNISEYWGLHSKARLMPVH